MGQKALGTRDTRDIARGYEYSTVRRRPISFKVRSFFLWGLPLQFVECWSTHRVDTINRVEAGGPAQCK
jgi:hypothetical protein